jgi:hypothetical protein
VLGGRGLARARQAAMRAAAGAVGVWEAAASEAVVTTAAGSGVVACVTGWEAAGWDKGGGVDDGGTEATA